MQMRRRIIQIYPGREDVHLQQVWSDYMLTLPKHKLKIYECKACHAGGLDKEQMYDEEICLECWAELGAEDD